MTISMGITDRATHEFRDIPVCTTATFQRFWLPAARKLELEMIELLPVLSITEEYRDRFLQELEVLDSWACNHIEEDAYFAEMRRRIGTVAELVRKTSLNTFEITFG